MGLRHARNQSAPARRTWWALACGALLASTLFVTPETADARRACATEPPPEGLVKRCHSMLFWLPDSMSEHHLRPALEVALIEWMRSCVIADRAPRLVYEAEESIDRIYELIKDQRRNQHVRIVPDYTPLTYREGGRTCYGVKSVTFRLPAAEGAVDDADDDEIEIVDPSDATLYDDMVKQAAKAATSALKQSTVKQTPSIHRFLRVLEQLERNGMDMDDTWYNLQTYKISNDAFDDPVACYRDEQRACLSGAAAEAACRRHLAERLVQAHHYYKVSPREFARILEGIASDIQSTIDHLHVIQRQDSAGAVPCPSIKTVFMPKIAELTRKLSIYSAGGY